LSLGKGPLTLPSPPIAGERIKVRGIAEEKEALIRA